MDVIVKGQPSIEIGFETKVIQVGGLGDIDSSLSTESENPVMNKVITVELNNKADKGEVTAALNTKADKNETDTKLTELSTETEAIHTELDSQNELIEDLQNTKIDKEADDYYPQLAVGLADNLAGVDVVDSEINFRRSGGGAISDGVARIEAIKGNSVVWNQCFGNGTTNKDYLKWEGNKATINGEFDADDVSFDVVVSGAKFVDPITNHKYLVEIDVISGTISGGIIVHYLPFADKAMIISENQLSVKTFVSSTTTSSYYFARTIRAGVIATNLKVMYRVTDLTKAFPNDWQNINTIEEFYSRIPMGVDLNAYNEGEVIHMDVQSIKSQGVNAWDEEWEQGLITDKDGKDKDSAFALRSNAFRVLPNTMYYVYMSKSDIYIKGFFYDNQMNFIGNGDFDSKGSTSFTVPSNAYYLRLRLYKGSDKLVVSDAPKVCINISDTSINGKYFPYIKRVEDLSIIRKYFPQGMKSAGSAHDEIRYNKATQKWEMVQRIGEVDLGSLAWEYNNSVGNERLFTLSLTDVMQVPNTATKGGLLTTLYSADSFNNIYSHSSDKLIGLHTNGQLVVYDSAYTDAVTFKTDMQGVMLYYELAEPIVTELDAEDQFKDLDYQVWNCGTEKAIAEGKSAPLAADITYGFNAIGKIKELESLVAQLRAKVGI